MSVIPNFANVPLRAPEVLAGGDDRNTWRRRLEEQRAGRDPVWHTPEQVDVQPLYSAEDLRVA